jgi:hypothetical protein
VESSWRIALRSAAMVEKTAGPRAAMQLYITVGENAQDPERGEGILSACQCAINLGLEDRATLMVSHWHRVMLGEWEAKVLAQARALLRKGWTELAQRLAQTEATARPRARLWYLVGRLATQRRDPGFARVAFERAVERASIEGSRPILATAQFERARLARAAGRTEIAERYLKEIDAEHLRAKDVVARAESLLASQSRFTRADALASLHRVATAPGALRLALVHADALGPALTPVERERIVAVARRALGDADFVKVNARLRDATADTAVAGPQVLPSPVQSPERTCFDALLQQRPEAERLCADLDAYWGARRFVPAAGWAVALAALERKAAWSTSVGGRLVERLLTRPHGRPVRGYAAVALALDAAGLKDLADRVLHVGAGRREPDAAEERALRLVRAAWELAGTADGAREPARARALLLEAVGLERLS